MALNVGIIGFGLSGRIFHAPLLKANKGFSVKMVSSSRAKEVKSVLPNSEVVSDPRQLIENPGLDLIINCAPNTHHYSYAAAALELGKHLVVEKPFVNSFDEGQRLLDLAGRKKKVISVFHNRRWDSDFLTVKRIIQSGRLGKVQQFESHMDRWRPTVRAERWREKSLPGSGLLYDLGSHLVDQAIELFGMPDHLWADIQCQKDEGQSDDYFHLILYYGKMRAILHSTSFAVETPRFQIFGNEKIFTKYGLDPQEDQLRRGLGPNDPSFGVEDDKNFGTLKNPESGNAEQISSERGCYAKYYEDLHSALTRGTEVPVSACEALRVIRLIELALQSSQKKSVLAV